MFHHVPDLPSWRNGLDSLLIDDLTAQVVKLGKISKRHQSFINPTISLKKSMKWDKQRTTSESIKDIQRTILCQVFTLLSVHSTQCPQYSVSTPFTHSPEGGCLRESHYEQAIFTICCRYQCTWGLGKQCIVGTQRLVITWWGHYF